MALYWALTGSMTLHLLAQKVDYYYTAAMPDGPTQSSNSDPSGRPSSQMVCLPSRGSAWEKGTARCIAWPFVWLVLSNHLVSAIELLKQRFMVIYIYHHYQRCKGHTWIRFQHSGAPPAQEMRCVCQLESRCRAYSNSSCNGGLRSGLPASSVDLSYNLPWSHWIHTMQGDRVNFVSLRLKAIRHQAKRPDENLRLQWN